MKRILAGFLVVVLLACNALAADLLFSESFESQAATSPWEEQVLSSHYTPNTAATKYVSTPTAHDGTYSAHYYALSGTNEHTAIQFFADSADFNTITGSADNTAEIYFSWHEYFESDYPFPTSSQKLFRIGYTNPAFPAEKKEIGVQIQSSNGDVNIQYFCGAWGDSSACNVGDAIHSGDPIELNEWVKFAIWIKLNTPGEEDGFIRLYKNDEIYLEGADIDLRGTNTKGFDFLWLGGNSSNLSGGTLPSSGSRYIDDVEWWDTEPDEEPEPTPTPAVGRVNQLFLQRH